MGLRGAAGRSPAPAVRRDPEPGLAKPLDRPTRGAPHGPENPFAAALAEAVRPDEGAPVRQTTVGRIEIRSGHASRSGSMSCGAGAVLFEENVLQGTRLGNFDKDSPNLVPTQAKGRNEGARTVPAGASHGLVAVRPAFTEAVDAGTTEDGDVTMGGVETAPVGFPVPGWTARKAPPRTAMEGTYCRVEPIEAERHGRELFTAYEGAADNWTYLAQDAPADFDEYRTWVEKVSTGNDPLFHALIEKEGGRAVGTAALMRIDAANGVIEIGSINYAPALKRSRAATEAIFLFMRRVFDELGYRRFEWKCDRLNAPSRRAALRYGFTFEGIFRQAIVYKGRNRDTAWFSMIDREWPKLRERYARWLDPDNFDGQGRQRMSLEAYLRGDG
jgi:RimJ/RimL family protein N-acetyltransferase